MALDKIQEDQIKMQLKNHMHDNYKTDITLSESCVLKDFEVHSKVLRPDKMTALFLARWLYYNNGYYLGKSVLDMGSGSGVQGVVTSLNGASRNVFSDLSPAAVKNTQANVNKYKLSNAEVFEGDLFERIKESFDVIIFNHPFFSDETIENLLVSSSMLGGGKLIHRFLDDAKEHLNRDGIIVMPYFHVAGPINDPGVQALEHNYTIFEVFRTNLKVGLQKGEMSIYILKLKE